MKKNRLNILLFTIISFILFINFINCDWGVREYFHVEVSLKNYPDIENYNISEGVIDICRGSELSFLMGGFFPIGKISENELFGEVLYVDSADLFLMIKEGHYFQKMRQSKDKISFVVDNNYYTTATWNEDGSVTVTQDDIKFVDKTFWTWYLGGQFKIDVTNIDSSLPFSPTFRLLLSDNNNIDNTNFHSFDVLNGELFVYNYVNVGEDYEPGEFYVKIEEYNSTSEQYELTKISKEKIINMIAGDLLGYNTIVDWNSGSPIIEEDDFKLFDDTAWNVVE
ncbi:MAG: hypothetical protein AMQ22_02322 [Candidatus Methanofastidiosum methylothiophilum]|uniref:Uncharacterized protein n=1 Tax=Candidatus Methanofastidiosum methylothiophilum TaxID=1705564 RepID=A0A150IH40_9EURY|nr:MAG: hypothetical protein AMQ22_02322 [Candidatus Methanofastidiosum methylthiophilus]